MSLSLSRIRRLIAIVLTANVMALVSLGQAPTERTERFDADPKWEARNNRSVTPRKIRQDFGYSATAHAGGQRGEMGGFRILGVVVGLGRDGHVHHVLGPALLHAGEAAEGGPIALLRPGDVVRIDIPDKRLEVNLSDEELTPWLSRVVKLPREGLAVEVTWSAGALERECASTKRAPELLCRNLAVLKYGARRATWDRASATFKLVKKHG